MQIREIRPATASYHQPIKMFMGRKKDFSHYNFNGYIEFYFRTVQVEPVSIGSETLKTMEEFQVRHTII